MTMLRSTVVVFCLQRLLVKSSFLPGGGSIPEPLSESRQSYHVSVNVRALRPTRYTDKTNENSANYMGFGGRGGLGA